MGSAPSISLTTKRTLRLKGVPCGSRGWAVGRGRVPELDGAGRKVEALRDAAHALGALLEDVAAATAAARARARRRSRSLGGGGHRFRGGRRRRGLRGAGGGCGGPRRGADPR